MEIDRNWCPKESEGCKVPGGGGDSAANGTCWIGWSNDWNASAATCRPADGWVGGTRRVPQRFCVDCPLSPFEQRLRLLALKLNHGLHAPEGRAALHAGAVQQALEAQPLPLLRIPLPEGTGYTFSGAFLGSAPES